MSTAMTDCLLHVWLQVANAGHDEIVEGRDPLLGPSENARFPSTERALHLEPWIAFFVVN